MTIGTLNKGVQGTTYTDKIALFVGMGTALDSPYRLEMTTPAKRLELYQEWIKRQIETKDKTVMQALNLIASHLFDGKDVVLIANGHWDERHAQAIIDLINQTIKESS